MCLSRFGDAIGYSTKPKVAARRSRYEASDGQTIGGESRRHGHYGSSERCPKKWRPERITLLGPSPSRENLPRFGEVFLGLEKRTFAQEQMSGQ